MQIKQGMCIIQETNRRDRERDSPTEVLGSLCPWLFLKQQRIDREAVWNCRSTAARRSQVTKRSRTGHHITDTIDIPVLSVGLPASRTVGRSWEMTASTRNKLLPAPCPAAAFLQLRGGRRERSGDPKMEAAPRIKAWRVCLPVDPVRSRGPAPCGTHSPQPTAHRPLPFGCCHFVSFSVNHSCSSRLHG
jgi:hypothetical protein